MSQTSSFLVKTFILGCCAVFHTGRFVICNQFEWWLMTFFIRYIAWFFFPFMTNQMIYFISCSHFQVLHILFTCIGTESLVGSVGDSSATKLALTYMHFNLCRVFHCSPNSTDRDAQCTRTPCSFFLVLLRCCWVDQAWNPIAAA